MYEYRYHRDYCGCNRSSDFFLYQMLARRSTQYIIYPMMYPYFYPQVMYGGY